MADERKKVVCIYDEPKMIDLAKLILGHKGFELTGAVGGREGVDAVRRVKPDLVLLGLGLPDMKGWEVNQCIKAEEELKDIPVIIVGSSTQLKHSVRFFRGIKVDDYLRAPFGPQALLQSVERVLRPRSDG